MRSGGQGGVILIPTRLSRVENILLLRHILAGWWGKARRALGAQRPPACSVGGCLWSDNAVAVLKQLSRSSAHRNACTRARAGMRTGSSATKRWVTSGRGRWPVQPHFHVSAFAASTLNAKGHSRVTGRST